MRPAHPRRAHAPLLPALALLAACSGGERSSDRAAAGREAARTTTLGTLAVTARAGALAAPDTVPAGWTRLRVTEDDAGHIVVLFRLPEDADLAAFSAALDSGAATPPGAIALGGPEVGDSGEVLVELTPGRHALGCVSRGRDGRRHAARGELREVVVGAAPSGADPAAVPKGRQEVRMADFAYVGADTWAPGLQLLEVRNAGKQDHQLRLARLRDGATVQDWVAAEGGDGIARDVAGVARLGPERVAYLATDLEAGEYVAYCLVPDPASGRPHVMLGMFRAIHVTPAARDASADAKDAAFGMLAGTAILTAPRPAP